jgi:dipeptidyl aminopeptidase/acylaminoacyl peptidase
MNRFLLVCALLVGLIDRSDAQRVSVQNGNVCISSATSGSKQLSSSGRDTQPVLSPDGKWVVFVRTVPGKNIATGSGDSAATELWQIGADGKNATLLVRSRESKNIQSVLANFAKPQFSTNGRYVFFLSDAWATSGAVHVVDTTNGKEHFVCPGLDLEVVTSGEYRDCLLVQEHRYFIGGGTYDWYWLLRPNGREIGPVGEETENFKSLYMEN